MSKSDELDHFGWFFFKIRIYLGWFFINHPKVPRLNSFWVGLKIVPDSSPALFWSPIQNRGFLALHRSANFTVARLRKNRSSTAKKLKHRDSHQGVISSAPARVYMHEMHMVGCVSTSIAMVHSNKTPFFGVSKQNPPFLGSCTQKTMPVWITQSPEAPLPACWADLEDLQMFHRKIYFWPKSSKEV